ncbi:bifunctional adenosylcobinamide kinase/adenosylcobinamide-phosphate guanylyltransferase [Candidatus Oleimmundimicrobium sp.]|uniref:bifunctional adenosylcobinamide kinase/adenosylcobinamide-phosphate guanylyltransferase n=1 Tax=Candidatus Oleimmundimicrobium sp. TaxID=3060597 RepID=UPI00271BFB3C|nr:bifunctional adenosylcobinamide kinase/adenosylcobinamide-phosphate guanylyltransferase [Candidatus Oleimmundimicrobium sp.]MDO8886109.1 bifunctional adenosylcobinamide kinase/adenosylcobinamide-phosphate guanylyltransferase [Candidatus Oleimmundimicrobium sp.]
MSELTFILGGARSGKSFFAEKMASKAKKVVYIATAEALDDEMRTRIENHKRERALNWVTLEAPDDLMETLRQIDSGVDVVIVDCLTLYISNLMRKFSEKEVFDDISKALNVVNNFKGKVIFVSNEVGLSIVPNNKLARDYRDILGKVNQLVAEAAKEVYLMVAGIPMKVK